MAKRKDVSLLVSATGWIASFVDKLVVLLRDRGISDEQIHALVTDDISAKAMLENIVDAIVETIKSARKVFNVFMDYSVSIENLVKQGKYDWSNSDITTKYFPTKHTGSANLKIELVSFDRNISSEDAIVELDKMGFRPAETGETLAFGVDNPNEQLNDPIVALGSVWRDRHGNRSVLYLSHAGDGRDARLSHFGGDWSADYRFAAIRK